MVKLGIIGLGHMGGYHAAISQSLKGVSVIGGSDTNPDSFSKITTPGAMVCSNYQDWIERADAVIIAVPTDLHYAITKDCLLRGKHVLLEKPITKTAEEAAELFAIAKRQNIALHIGHVERFNSAVRQVRSLISDPILIESHRIGPFNTRPSNDSVIIDLMIHDIDIILSLIDSPVKETSIFGSNVKTDLCDLASLMIKFENGVIAKVVSSRASHKRKRTMRIHQMHSYIDLDFATQEITIHSLDKTHRPIGGGAISYDHHETIQHIHVPKGNALKLEIEHFLDSIKTGQNLIDSEHDLSALALALRAQEALRI